MLEKNRKNFLTNSHAHFYLEKEIKNMKLDLSFVNRRKQYDQTNIQSTNLDRVLGLVDITALGVSCTLGNGIYVLAGDVIANYAGPSIVLSFLIAGLATCIAGKSILDFVRHY